MDMEEEVNKKKHHPYCNNFVLCPWSAPTWLYPLNPLKKSVHPCHEYKDLMQMRLQEHGEARNPSSTRNQALKKH